jgi:hypothetical protein
MGLHTGRQSVTTPGTKVSLTSARTAASYVTVQAWDGNAGPIYVGDSTVQYDVSANGKSYTGHKLVPGDFANLREIGGTTYLDLKNVYIDADNAADGCCFNYGVR